jgi:hypothetical protein
LSYWSFRGGGLAQSVKTKRGWNGDSFGPQLSPSSLALQATRDRELLKRRIKRTLSTQGFSVSGNVLTPPETVDKNELRSLHSAAVRHRLDRAEPYLRNVEPRLLDRVANGYEVIPESINPRLVQVYPRSEEELLFRYISLHWSIPVSSGYGRRLRFLVMDQQNNKVMGAFGLGDPVFNVGARDSAIGWNREAKKARLHNVMEAFLVGAVPPYSYLLAGKLVAMLMASNEVRRSFQRKYSHASSLISGRRLDGRLVLITTISALGRSSIYNRISFQGRRLVESVGYTQGYGDFHFANGLYTAIRDHAQRYCVPSARASAWGDGFRNRREVIKKCLVDLDLPSDWVHHGIKRELFLIPLGERSIDYLQGNTRQPGFFDASASSLASHWRQRWAVPRSERDTDFSIFLRSGYRLWEQER